MGTPMRTFSVVVGRPDFEPSCSEFDAFQRDARLRGRVDESHRWAQAERNFFEYMTRPRDDDVLALDKLCIGLQTDIRRLLTCGNNPMIESALSVVFSSK